VKDLMLNSILKSPFGDYWLLKGEFVNKFIFSWLGFVFVTVASFSSCALLILVLSRFDYSLNRLIFFRHGNHHSFSQIDCPFPDVLSKSEFLEEVRYLGGLKDNIDFFEPELLAKIHSAFKSHPWVDKVVGIERSGSTNLKVMLDFRIPVLVVPIIHSKDQPENVDHFRVVDANAIILPKNASQVGLPIFTKSLAFPSSITGAQWQNVELIGCSKVLGLLSRIVVFPKECLVAANGNQIQIHSLDGKFKINWGLNFNGDSISKKLIDQRLETISGKYKEWSLGGMIQDFNVNLTD